MSLSTSRLNQYTTVGNKIPLIVPQGYLRYNVSLEPTGSVAKIQHTFYPIEVVEADPSLVTWYDWPPGQVSSNTDARIVGAPTAIRVVVVSGINVTLVVSFTDE